MKQKKAAKFYQFSIWQASAKFFSKFKKAISPAIS